LEEKDMVSYQSFCGSRDGEIIDINGHKWRIVDTRFTHSGPTYRYKDVVNAGGHIPYPIARSSD
jgi:hypothetical protein